MNRFELCTPTRIVFGKGTISALKNLINPSAKVMMIYGGGSIFKNGVYDQVKKALNGFNLSEFGGIEANPRYETCMKAVEQVKATGADFLLAVGGGSVLDATKFIAAAVEFTGGDPWLLCSEGAAPTGALPLGDVITLPATGSEMNGGAVISRNSTQEKFAFISPLVIPKFSIIDPETTYSLPPKQTINGIVDTFVHVMEQYATRDVNSPLQDLMALSIIRVLIQEAPKVLRNPDDYDARANLFWCATLGLNSWIAAGVIQDWATHMIGHELTAEYGIDHGQSLAIVMPKVWRYKFETKRAKLAKMAREIWNSAETDESDAANEAIFRTLSFFHSIGMPTELSDYKIDPIAASEAVKHRFTQQQCRHGEAGDIDAEAAAKILLI